MSDAHTFEHDGITVTFYPAKVSTVLEKRRIARALIDAYDLNGKDIPGDTWDNFDEFSAAMAQGKADAAWWTSSMASPQRIREAYECFMEQDPSLLYKLVTASNAVAVPKKTNTKVPLTPES